MKAVVFKGVGIGTVTQSAGGVVRHVLRLGYLPHRPVPQPEPSTDNIVPAHHEAMSAVLVATSEEVVVVLYGHTGGPLCILAFYCRSVGSRVNSVSKAAKRQASMRLNQVQRTGCLGKTIHPFIASKPDVRRRPHEGNGKGCIVGEGEVTQNVLYDTAIAGSRGREGEKSRLRVADYYSTQSSSDK